MKVGRPRMLCWVLQCQFCQIEKVPNFVVGQVLSYSSGNQLLDVEVQYMFTLICMQHLCASVIRDMDCRIFNVLHDLLMHA